MDTAPPDGLFHAPADMAGEAARAAFQLRSLDVFVGIGTRLAQRMEKQIVALDWVGADGHVMFEQLARAVRRTIALQLRIDEERRTRTRQDAVERTERVRRAVERVIDAQAKRADQSDKETDPRDREDLLSELNERLGDVEFEAMALLPVAETVAVICRELGITPPDDVVWTEADGSVSVVPDRRRPAAPLPPLDRLPMSLSVPWPAPVAETAHDPP